MEPIVKRFPRRILDALRGGATRRLALPRQQSEEIKKIKNLKWESNPKPVPFIVIRLYS